MRRILEAASGPFYTLGFLALAIFSLATARDVLIPIAIALLLWFLINAIADALQRAPAIGPTLPRMVAKGAAILILLGLAWISINVVVSNLRDLGNDLPAEEDVILLKLEALAARLGFHVSLEPRQVYDLFRFDALIGQGLSLMQGFITNTSLILLYVMFLLIDERYYEQKLRALVRDDDRRAELEGMLAEISTETRLYLWLMTILSAGVALMTYALCAMVGLQGAGFWAFLAFVLNFVPTIGSITAVVLPCLYALLTLANPVLLLVLIAGLSATQFVAGEVVLPRLMGNRLNLSSVVILLVLVVWGAIWGPAGMFLAIPFTVIMVLVSARFRTTRPIALVLSRDGKVPDLLPHQALAEERRL